ncbi:MAG: metallophosphoesterase [Deltaproteobacteria bacterium]|nr:metallophosphoesterase [Deltaproteobacteria bacterium]
MKVGILSDSHDKRGSAADALAVFLREHAEAVLHLGDVCSPPVVEPFRKAAMPFHGVFGNNDYDRFGLQTVSGNGFHRGPHVIELAGRKILMAHAFDDLQGEMNERGKFDLVLFGHTHRPLTMRMGSAIVINPGESCGFMSGRATCAVIDLSTMDARILNLAEATAVAAGGFDPGTRIRK